MAQHQQAHRFTRRSFCCTLTGILAAPGMAVAQTSKAVRRIGLLWVGMPYTPEDIQEFGAPFRELGWVVSRNLRIEARYANGKAEALRGLAEELIRANVEVIVTKGNDGHVGCEARYKHSSDRFRRRQSSATRHRFEPCATRR